MTPQRRTLIAAACALTCATLLTLPAQAQAQTIRLAGLYELSGAGATAGTNFKNGVDMAVKEINAAGGILGKKLEHTISDTQTNPGVAKGLATKAIDDNAFAVFGPVFSGSIMVSMAETRKAEVPNFTGGEAAGITKQGNPYIFRTSFTQDTAMPKVARYIASNLKAKNVAVMYVNNDFGKGGRDAITKALEAQGVKVVADISTDSGQVDFSAPVLKAKGSNADALFVYTNEEESARALRELRKQGFNKPIVGETTLTGQKVIELAGDAAAFQRARDELAAVGLAERLNHYPAQLSGGEQQRVALARALAPNPAILVADEPTGNLDEATGRQVIELLFAGHVERGTTLILVTHDAALAQRCDRIVHLRSGRIESARRSEARMLADGL